MRSTTSTGRPANATRTSQENSRKQSVARAALVPASALLASLWLLPANARATSPPPAPAPVAKVFTAASISAAPGSECELYPEGSTDPADHIPVFADEDGIARFYAVRATAADTVRKLVLDCKDAAGKPATYAVDLQSDATFAARTFDLAAAPGLDRPALQGDPLKYTQAELLQAGYGLRPDPVKSAAAYRNWLDAASRSGRRLQGRQPSKARRKPLAPATVYSTQAPNWTGAVLNGAQDYVVSVALFNVPTAIPGGDGTGSTGISIWNGLGGYGTGGGLIQGGVQIFTNSMSASYVTFREYCCGDPDSNTYKVSPTPHAGDQIFSEEWYCDATGAADLQGGYGCTFLEDETTGGIFSCTSKKDAACLSVKALPSFTLGEAADFVIEMEQGPAFTAFTPAVTMQGTAYSSALGVFSDVTTDPTVFRLIDFTNSPLTEMQVTLGSPDLISWNIAPGPLASGCPGSRWCPRLNRCVTLAAFSKVCAMKAPPKPTVP